MTVGFGNLLIVVLIGCVAPLVSSVIRVVRIPAVYWRSSPALPWDPPA